MRAQGPIAASGCTMVRAPMTAPAPTEASAPIETPAPSVASGATRLDGSTPGAGGDAGVNNATARAKAVYGSSVRRTAHGGRSPAGPRITADAFVPASCAA